MKPWLALINIVMLLASSMRAEAAKLPIAKTGCKDQCGNVSIPFPWGFGSNCSLDEWHEMECRETNAYTTKSPFLTKLNVEVMKFELGVDYMYEQSKVIIRLPPTNSCTTNIVAHHNALDLRGGPYVLGADDNVFVMEGCSGGALLVGESHTSNTTVGVGCSTSCPNNNTATETNYNCLGDNCCQTTLSNDLMSYQVHLYPDDSLGRKNCLVSTLIRKDEMNPYVGKSWASDPSRAAPVALTWSWISSTKPDSDPNTTYCEQDDQLSWTCSCNIIYIGNNPYVHGGCGDHICESCFEDDTGPPLLAKVGMNIRSFLTSSGALIFYIAVSIAIAPLLLVFGCRWLYRFTKRRRKAERRVKFFKLMLQKHQSSNNYNGVVECTKLFTHKELDKATEHFSDNRVLGKGGQGTVYKGMLTDGRIVAVKKSKQMDGTQMEQFINEVVILSQTNHKNVVKLLGCCLETEVPLLAYEYISNGTLYQLIHDPSEDASLTWAMRLKIAIDSAGAIAYLHSFLTTPIYHRDIKSANILLDDKYRVKVSDFGISKTLEIDQTHLTTLVQGTFGYLDPEYFESSVYTEKSEVYSFGVVLLELLTSKKPIFRDEEMEQKGLAPEFLIQMQNQTLSSILDPEVLKEAKEEEILAYADLAKRCLSESGRLRPTMREVAMTLEMIIKPPTQIDAQGDGSLEDEGFDEIVMSDTELKSSSARVDAVCSFYIDVAPLLHDTI